MSYPVDTVREPESPLDGYIKLADDYASKLRRGAPNALTLGNLTCGLFSLIMAINGLHRFSALFIFLAAACDYFDGRVARMLGVTTAIGAQLDSLADLVSFGVAPAILAHSIKDWSFLMFIAFVSFP
jgi:CDP-diacylglycerol--serine O-phosphatidyltransferase